MDQFVYSDIFATKGIEYLVVIGFLLLIIPFWVILNRPVHLKEKATGVMGILSAQILRIPQGLLYGRNHTWTYLEKSGLASVGMDDLLLHLTGGVDIEFLRDQQDKVMKGEPIARIKQDGKTLVIASPISGEIDSVHNSLEQDPGAIIEDPYKSWLFRIKPDKWREETSDCYLAAGATEWARKELERFKDFIAESLSQRSGSPAVVLQEGGELTDHPLAEMNQEVWDDFQGKFLDSYH